MVKTIDKRSWNRLDGVAMKTENDGLLDCPFCGETPVWCPSGLIGCPGCKASAEFGVWNRRVEATSVNPSIRTSAGVANELKATEPTAEDSFGRRTGESISSAGGPSIRYVAHKFDCGCPECKAPGQRVEIHSPAPVETRKAEWLIGPSGRETSEACATARTEDELRDGFAMAALTGIVGNSKYDDTAEQFAVVAFNLADAMLTERSKRMAVKLGSDSPGNIAGD